MKKEECPQCGEEYDFRVQNKLNNNLPAPKYYRHKGPVYTYFHRIEKEQAAEIPYR